jgi:hypothetical protein
MQRRPLLSYLRRPVFASSAPARLTLWDWVGWVGLLIAVMALISWLDAFLAHAYGRAPAQSAWMQFLHHPSWMVVAVVLPAPALEELGFRAFLSTAPKFIFTGLAFFAAYLCLFIRNNLVGATIPTSPAAALVGYLHAFWVVLAAGTISLLLYRYRREAITQFFHRRAAWVFWISCALFGAGHTLLYTNSFVWWGFALVMPQFLAGIGLAYVRVTFGLRWSIASHYAIDTLAVLPSWLYVSSSPGSPLYGAFLMASLLILAIMAYGLVALRRVAQLRW